MFISSKGYKTSSYSFPSTRCGSFFLSLILYPAKTAVHGKGPKLCNALKKSSEHLHQEAAYPSTQGKCQV